ncbi:MAG: DoxX family protein [Marinifilaceae bacterium]|jgi:putative oxidoreductase|nr:DoxX family protein [Marinifilaceae bacterium]
MGKIRINTALLIIRLSLGVLMLFHGFAKIGNLDGVKYLLSSNSLPEFFAYAVFIGEIIAPILIILGFRTKIAAIVFAFNCVVAMLLAHSNDFLQLNQHGAWKLELLGLYLFASIALIFSGGGRYSLSRFNYFD